MKTNKSSSISFTGVIFLFPFLVACMVFLSPKLMSSVSVENYDAKAVKQYATPQNVISILGRVVDLDHNALEGVTVIDKNSDVDQMTDELGKFELVLDKPTQITFVKIGFNNVYFNATASDSNLVIIMTRESNELIVRGFESKVYDVNENKWVLDSLKSFKNQPLYIINDVNMDYGYDLKTLKPEDIKSIEVLKDTPASLYGLGAKNGVVKIYTKNYNSFLKDESNKMMKLDTSSPIKIKDDFGADTINNVEKEGALKINQTMDSTMMKRAEKMEKNNPEFIKKEKKDLK